MTIRVSIGKLQGKIDQKIYGHFIEQALNCINGGIFDPDSSFAGEDGIREDVSKMVAELAPPIIRFPGGTVMCQYHWEDAVGPIENRIHRKNLIWGGELDPSFGTAEFVTFCRKIGAEPMICVNMESGTPEEAGNWVEYCNGTGHSYYAELRRSHGFEEPFNVKYWCIGNESYAEPDIGVHHDVQLYVRDAMEFIKFMKLTDKSIKTVIVGGDRFDWNKTVLDALNPVTDYFSIHHYSGEIGKGLYGPFEGEKQLIKTLDQVSALINTYPDNVTDFNPWYRFPPRSSKIHIALDEWNIWDFDSSENYGLLQRYCWRDALWTASILNTIISRPIIGMANMAQMVNVLAPIVTEKDGAWYQTIAYPLRLYRHTMLGDRITISFNSPVLDGGIAGQIEALSVSAARNEDGTIWIGAVNRDFSKEYIVSLEGDGVRSDQKVSMTVLTGDSPEAKCSFTENHVHESIETVSVDKIPLHAGSVSMIKVPIRTLD